MNNNPRFYLWLALAFVLWLNYTAWQREFPPQPAVRRHGAQPDGTLQTAELARQQHSPGAAVRDGSATAAPADATPPLRRRLRLPLQRVFLP